MNTDLTLNPAADIEVMSAEPVGPVDELARALKLVAPSLGDHKGVAMATVMIMRKRGVVLSRTIPSPREGVPFQ